MQREVRLRIEARAHQANKWPLMVGALLAFGAAGCDGDCEPQSCDALAGSDFSSNGRTYEECISCTSSGTCYNEILDDAGTSVFECTSEPEDSGCTDAFVEAQFAYCEIQ